MLNLRFPGQYYDVETGFYYNIFRNYESAIGSYLEVDPLAHDQPLSWGVAKSYSYVESRPTRFIDPLGLFKWDKSCTNCLHPDVTKKFEQETADACHRIPLLITNIRRAKCMTKSCELAIVSCGPCKQIKDPDGGISVGGAQTNSGLLWLPHRKSTICMNASPNFNNPGLSVGVAGIVLVHEFAHQCGWDDKGGEGVPDPWSASYPDEASRWGFK